jgi:tape measure domain-containing protein
VAKDVTLLIKLNDQASGKIGKITNSTKRLERAANGAQNSIRRTNKGIRETGRAADKASKGVNNLGKAVRGLAAGFGVFQAGKFVIFKTAELERQTKSLEVLTGSLGNARSIIKELQQFGAVTPFTSSELIETAKRLKAFGFQTEEVVDVTKRLADVAGATGADLGGIATAFGQIQAKGRLQGEELLQLQERGVSLQDELQKMYGLTADEFRKALEGGRISADAVNLALQNITDTGGKYANGAIAQSETLAGKFSTLADQIERVAQKIGEKLTPLLRGALTIAINLVDNINRSFAAGALTDQQRQGFKREAEQEVMRFAGPMPGGAFGAGQVVVRHLGKTYTGSASSVVSQITNDLINREVERMVEGARGPTVSAPSTATSQPPSLLSSRGGGAEKVDMSQRLLDLSNQLRDAQEREQLRLAATLRLMVEKQRIAESNLLPRQKENELDQAHSNFRKEVLGIDAQIAEQRQKDFATQMKHQDELRAKIAEQKNQYEELNTTFRNGIVDSILDAVDGTKSLSESLAGVLKQMARMILQQQLMNALGGFNLFGGGGGGAGGGFGVTPATSGLDFSGAFANGGRPAVGKAALVGERGPELFVPDRAGTIVANHAMGGANVTVNVDASGSSVDGDADEAAQLGKAIGVAVQQELIKQKRPGGLLAS